MNVLVLGATGTVGTRVAIELFRSRAVDRLRVAARDHSAAAAFAARFSTDSSTKVLPATIDVLAPGLPEQLVGEDVVVNCAGPGFALEGHGVAAAVAAGVNYVSLCDDDDGTDDALAHDAAAREAGLVVVSGCGLSPGITSFLSVLAARELDEVREIHISVAASSADSDGFASAEHLVHSLGRDATFLSEGTIAREKAGTAPKLVYFPEPVGWVETFVCGHPEVVTIPRARPGLSTIQFRIGLAERVVMDLLRGARAAGLLRSEAARRMWLRATWPSRSLVERIPPRGPAWTAARVDVRGIAHGTTSTVSLAVVDHLVNLASATATEAALALGRGEARTVGVRGPEEVLDPATLVGRLSTRGIRVARLEPEPV